jgi:hypothetical protein
MVCSDVDNVNFNGDCNWYESSKLIRMNNTKVVV